MKRITLLQIIFFSFINFSFPQTPESLLRSSSVIKSIDPSDEDYTDLLPLKKKIEEAQIIVLGETSNNDGATLLAKSRLVKFFHKEMGFDILAWEAGLIDCYNMNSALKSVMPIKDAKKYLLNDGREESEYVNPVFEYARQSWKTERPLIMAGFDFGKSLKTANNYLGIFDSIFTKAPWLKPADSIFTRIDTCTKILCSNLRNQLVKKFSKKGEQIVKYFIYSLIDSLTLGKKYSENISREEKLKYSYLLRSFYFDIELNSLIYQSDEIYKIMHDKFMADRILWLFEKFYPGKKIIIWSLTSHFRKNSFLQIQFKSDLSFFSKSAVFLQAGDYLDYYLGKKVYTIAFTTFQGERGLLFPESHLQKKDYEYTVKINEPDAGSYEANAHETEKEFLFTDLRSIRKSNWLSKENVAYPLDYKKTEARWGELVDAFFFIDKMFPDKILPIDK